MPDRYPDHVGILQCIRYQDKSGCPPTAGQPSGSERRSDDAMVESEGHRALFNRAAAAAKEPKEVDWDEVESYFCMTQCNKWNEVPGSEGHLKLCAAWNPHNECPWVTGAGLEPKLKAKRSYDAVAEDQGLTKRTTTSLGRKKYDYDAWESDQCAMYSCTGYEDFPGTSGRLVQCSGYDKGSLCPWVVGKGHTIKRGARSDDAVAESQSLTSKRADSSLCGDDPDCQELDLCRTQCTRWIEVAGKEGVLQCSMYPAGSGCPWIGGKPSGLGP